MITDIERRLAPPGAGLPLHELYIGRLLFTVRRWASNRDSINARFQRERETIRELVDSCEPEFRARRVLIRRPSGLEDSSRYWSVWMTLDHLRIVHHSMIRVIGALTRGILPPGTASTATVKPSPEAATAALDEFEKSCDSLLATVAAADNLNTVLCYAHPWFGPLNAAGWHALAAGHLAIHRVQMERILQSLKGSQP